MYKPLALIAAACVFLAPACQKKAEHPVGKVIPTEAPKAAKAPGAVLEHMQYAVVRRDPAHLESFYPAVDESLAIGTTIWFHNDGGFYGIALTGDEIEKLGIRHLLEAGYISDKWTSRAIREAGEGKRDLEPGMELVDQNKLDMPQPTNIKDKKLKESLEKQMLEALGKNPKGAYAAGLYRLLRVVPDEGWSLMTAALGINPNKDYKDLVLKAGDTHICTVTVGQNDDETMFITAVEFKKGPAYLAKLFAKAQEAPK
jgi:hypothetical protein